MNHSFCFYSFFFFGIIFARYFLIAGGAYLLFYLILGKFLVKKSLRLKPPLRRLIWKDVKLSVLSSIVFAFCAAFIILEYDLGVTLLYTDLHKYGLWYLGVSFVSILILQDTYFYFSHRIFHHRLLFKWVHFGHHISGEPTPWNSFAFDLPEAIVQSFFVVSVIFIVPLHFFTLIAVLMTMTIWSVLNHLGFELFPSSFRSHWFGRWFISSTHHSIHHRNYTVHYGLYFTLWDKLLGTQDRNYDNELHSYFAGYTTTFMHKPFSK
ncbi:sterol desaturase family protein [Calothrix sp. NIES-4071]|nr:sterol desaturase family protein [Calothrix sp. NIES-4071]BAZ54788.1 sterol desaturase family protein [Calothrix sp. NIES-4105]